MHAIDYGASLSVDDRMSTDKETLCAGKDRVGIWDVLAIATAITLG